MKSRETPIVSVKKIQSFDEREHAFHIRRKVFMEEQRVSEEEEFDQWDNVSVHFLASIDGFPVGTARWRWTDEGAKLERFCTLEEYRGNGVATELVVSLMDDIITTLGNKPMYLYAQVQVIPFYRSFGFKEEGEEFDDAGIPHKKMILHT